MTTLGEQLDGKVVVVRAARSKLALLHTSPLTGELSERLPYSAVVEPQYSETHTAG